MITPRFEVSQDEQFVIIKMKIKYIKASECEFYFQDNMFRFYSKPYFLKLTLPQLVESNGQEKAVFDMENEALTVHVPKKVPGTFFENLDMITNLLGEKNQPPTNKQKNLIEVMDSNSPEENDLIGEGEDVEYDWTFPQIIEEEEEFDPLKRRMYGFNDQYEGFFVYTDINLEDILDNPYPETMTLEEIKKTRDIIEENHFNPDHYIGDYIDDGMVQECIQYTAYWEKEFKAKKLKVKEAKQKKNLLEYNIQNIDEEIIQFSKEDIDRMIRLPRKEYIIENEKSVLLGLVDIIFAYAYNHRINMGEDNVESHWTIAKVSPTLSWLDKFETIQDVIISCMKRALCYPLYRHFGLICKVIQDVYMLFYLGKRALVKVLCEVKSIFDLSDSRHYLSRIYIDDYCVWTQKVQRKKIKSLCKAIRNLKVSKNDIPYSLLSLENLAKEYQMSETQ